MSRGWSNWAGNQTSRPQRVVTPASTDETVRAVTEAAEAGLTVRAAGSLHSFTDTAMTDGMVIRPHGMTGLRSIDPGTGLVTVDAGMPLRTLCAVLADHGLALTNMGDVDVQTVAGAISTGTHGTGRASASLAAQVRALELVLADGSVVTASPDGDPELWNAACVGLGALGVITAVTIQAEPAFLLNAREEPMPWDTVVEAFDDLAADNEHFEFFYFPHTSRTLVKRNNRATGPVEPLPRWRAWLDDEFLAGTVFGLACRAMNAAPRLTRPLNQVSARALSARDFTDTSYKVFTSPRTVRFVEMEYAVPRSAAVTVLLELRKLIDSSDWYVSFPVEVRVAPGDDLWLSTAYGRDSVYIAAHMYHRTPPAVYQAYFGALEALMAEYGGRPHWGKLHTRTAEHLAGSYPRFAEFLAVRDKLDPDRRFANAYLRRVLGD